MTCSHEPSVQNITNYDNMWIHVTLRISSTYNSFRPRDLSPHFLQYKIALFSCSCDLCLSPDSSLANLSVAAFKLFLNFACNFVFNVFVDIFLSSCRFLFLLLLLLRRISSNVLFLDIRVFFADGGWSSARSRCSRCSSPVPLAMWDTRLKCAISASSTARTLKTR